jgi:long-chain acyl-CoA synthetase
MYPGAYLDAFPTKPAVIVAATGEKVTFAELESNSIRIARAFNQLGLRPGDHLAVLATNTPRVFDLYWAAMRSGLYMTMVNWHLTAGEAAYIVNDSGAKVVVVDAALSELADELIEVTPTVAHRLSVNGEIANHQNLDTLAADEPEAALADQPRGADMLYSSGTTGRPKGIKPPLPGRQVGEPGDVVVDMNARVWSVGPDTVALSPAPLYHSAPLRFFGAVTSLGGTVVLVDRFDAEKSLKYIEQYGVTHSQWVPTMLIRMLKLPEETRNSYDLSSLRVAIHAAAPCPVETKRQIIKWWGPIVWEFYSTTEVNGMTIVSSDEWLQKPGTVGRAALGIPHVCDKNGADLPTGEVGTIYFERDSLVFEYHNDPEKTREAQHPQHPSWITTGDVGYLDEDGYLFLTDRDSFLIISGGVNIYPQEIENLLLDHPSVLDAGVIGMPDPELGEIVTAVVLPTPGVDGDAELSKQLLGYLGEHLAKYKLPREILYGYDLPRTPTGKLVKRQLKEQILAKLGTAPSTS